MSRIIALKGRAESGKSTTIGLIPAILTANGYTPQSGSKRQYGKDFLEIYMKGSVKLGITSAGDTYDLVHQRLTTLVNAKCNDIICACRTHGGTHDAIYDFTGYTAEFIQKTYANSVSLELTANASDAKTLFAKI